MVNIQKQSPEIVQSQKQREAEKWINWSNTEVKEKVKIHVDAPLALKIVDSWESPWKWKIVHQ